MATTTNGSTGVATTTNGTTSGSMATTTGGAASRTKTIRSSESKLCSDIARVQSDIPGLQSNVARLQPDIPGLQPCIARLQPDIPGVQSDIPGVQSDIPGVQPDIPGVQSDIKTCTDITTYEKTKNRYKTGGDVSIKMKQDVDMCDKTTRVWTCRVGLLITVCGVLCLMMFQIWTYYFSLVSEMDTLTFATPEVKAVVKTCVNATNDATFLGWNVDDCQHSSSATASCTLYEKPDALFIDYTGGNARVNDTVVYFDLPSAGCALLKVWQLPWGDSI